MGKSKVFGRETPDTFAVHGELRRTGRRYHDRHARVADLDQDIGCDGLDFGHDDIRSFLFDQAFQRDRVAHGDHMGAMRDLVAGRVGVTVHGDGFHAQALQRDDDFLAEFAAAQKHDAGGGR